MLPRDHLIFAGETEGEEFDLSRDVVDLEHTWKIEDIYGEFDHWNRDRQTWLDSIYHLKNRPGYWLASPSDMLVFLNTVSDIRKRGSRLYLYASLLSDTDMTDSLYQGHKGDIHTAMVDLQSHLSFMQPDILKLGHKGFAAFVDVEPALAEYRMWVEPILRMKKHVLPARSARIVSMTNLFSGATAKASSILNDVEIPAPEVSLADGKKIKLNWSGYSRYRGVSDPHDRRMVMARFWQHHSGFRNTLAALIDGAVKADLFQARVHRYRDCLEAALKPNRIDTRVYTRLIESIRGRLAPLHRYLRLKAKLLELDEFRYADIYASAIPSVDRIFSVEEAKSLILESLSPLGAEYQQILNQGFNQRWMDIYPNRGKRSGAYSNGSDYDGHPFVLMNFNGKFDSVSTLTHEFGHALHSHFSNRNQPYPLAQYPIFLAEIASTFNEALLISHLLKTETDSLFKLFILDKYVEGLRGTLYRQTLFAEFELLIHRHVEGGGTLTPDWLDKTYLELTEYYYGQQEGVLVVDDYIRNEWSHIPHFYYQFYVYQYSTGIVAATALAERVLNGGREERDLYLDFLRSGGSDYPLEILQRTGVDLTRPEPITETVNRVSQIVAQMEKLAAKTAID